MDTIACCGNNGMHSHVLQHCYLKEMELRNSESQAPQCNQQTSVAQQRQPALANPYSRATFACTDYL
jgi:hypothetical protein